MLFGLENVEKGRSNGQLVGAAPALNRVNVKYEVRYPEAFFLENACFRLRPAWAFALRSDDFEGSPTRWVFDEGD